MHTHDVPRPDSRFRDLGHASPDLSLTPPPPIHPPHPPISQARAEIDELITQLEACNPTASPTEEAVALSGTWALAYTSNSELMAILALSRLPGVEVGQISQTIDVSNMNVQNKVELEVPLSRTSVSNSGSLEVRSPKRLQVRFSEGTFATPQLLDDIQLPSSLDILGQTIDLSPAAPVLEPLKGTCGRKVQI